MLLIVQFLGFHDPVSISRLACHSYGLPNGRKIQLFQFPITLSWAITAHKSQGQTLSRIAIDIDQAAFAHGSLYVALSRVHRLDDAHLFGCEEWPQGGPQYYINPCIVADHARETE